ncbi:MAG: sigma-E factor regulatory protein RseB domain-containing protein [Acidimicrobiia bacterium]
MSRRLALVLCLALAALAVLLAGPRGAQADDRGAAKDLLHRSRDAVFSNEFEGTVVVEWSEGGHRHRRTVAVQVGGGVIHMGDDRLVSAGTRRLLRTDHGWQVLWAGGQNGSEPDPTDKYRFVVKRSATVAQRPATQLTITRAGTREVRERLFFDDATGMLLRRDQLDEHGRVMRRFAFVQMSEPRAVVSSKHNVPNLGRSAGSAAPRALKDVPDDLRAPKRIGDGFVLSGIYSQPDGSVQLYYSDGLLGLSVFERTGQLDWESLPTGGRTAELGDVRAKIYRTAAGAAVVWGSHDVTYTCVTDAPVGEVSAIAAGLSGSGDSSALEDAGRFVTAPFSWG